jgi:hypothetical protein
MLQEAAQELSGAQAQGAPLLVGTVFVLEGDVATVRAEDALGYPVRRLVGKAAVMPSPSPEEGGFLPATRLSPMPRRTALEYESQRDSIHQPTGWRRAPTLGNRSNPSSTLNGLHSP